MPLATGYHKHNQQNLWKKDFKRKSRKRRYWLRKKPDLTFFLFINSHLWTGSSGNQDIYYLLPLEPGHQAYQDKAVLDIYYLLPLEPGHQSYQDNAVLNTKKQFKTITHKSNFKQTYKNNFEKSIKKWLGLKVFTFNVW